MENTNNRFEFVNINKDIKKGGTKLYQGDMVRYGKLCPYILVKEVN